MAGFGALIDRMDASIMKALNDGLGDYFDAAGLPVAQGIELIVDQNLERAGAGGVFLSDAIGITWNKPDLASVARGGRFLFDSVSYIVEETIADDGHMATAACMVQQ